MNTLTARVALDVQAEQEFQQTTGNTIACEPATASVRFVYPSVVAVHDEPGVSAS